MATHEPLDAASMRAWLIDTFYGGSAAAAPPLGDASLLAAAAQLHQLRQLYTSRMHERTVLTADAEERAHAYAFEARRLRQLNEASGITAEHLSRSGRTSLTTLAQCADELSLKDVRASSYLLALHRLSQTSAAAAEAAIVAEREATECEQAAVDARRELADVRRACKLAATARDGEAARLAERRKQTPLLRQVADECRAAVANDKKHLAALSVSKDLFHSELQRRAQRIEDVERELAPLNQALSSFRGLPPDVSLAEARVAAAEQELVALQEELARELEGLDFAA